MNTPPAPPPSAPKSFLHTPLAAVEDETFQGLINELYHCTGWERDDAALLTCFYLLSAIGVQARASLTQDRLPGEGILTGKVEALPPGSPVALLCQELAKLAHTTPGAFEGKAVLTLIKECFPWPEPRKEMTAAGEDALDRLTKVILQRRANGDL